MSPGSRTATHAVTTMIVAAEATRPALRRRDRLVAGLTFRNMLCLRGHLPERVAGEHRAGFKLIRAPLENLTGNWTPRVTMRFIWTAEAHPERPAARPHPPTESA